MKVSVMQPYLFPYIGYFQLINHADTFVFFDDVSYIKKGYINRNNYIVNGNKKLVTLPVLKASQNKKINQLYFVENVGFFLKTIYLNYKKSKYFDCVYPLIEKALTVPDKGIVNVCMVSTKLILDYLNIDKDIVLSSEVNYSRDADAPAKVISICQTLNASHYINPIGGRNIYDKSVFDSENIKLSFLKTNFAEYKQNSEVFYPGLSILDVLMSCSKETVLIELNNFELV